MKYFKIIALMTLLSTINIYSQQLEQNLNKVIDKLNSMKAITYQTNDYSSVPYDTVMITQYTTFHKVKFEPNDTLIGASFLTYLNDTTKLILSYSNNIACRYDCDTKTIILDTLKEERISLTSPFYVKVSELLKYVISNHDSVRTAIQKDKDTTKFTFNIPDRYAEFFNKIPSVFLKKGETSSYTLWTNKEYLPFRLKREMPYQTSIEEVVSYQEINASEIQEMQVGIYLPEGFEIRDKNGKQVSPNELEGDVAPPWKLFNLDIKQISLSDYANKNMLLVFTGVGCGACHSALPFLNEFATYYKTKGFEVISVESFSKNINALKHYKEVNKINYEFLLGDKETVGKYKIQAVPIFLLINKKGKVEKVYLGYSKGETDKKINECANTMLNQN